MCVGRGGTGGGVVREVAFVVPNTKSGRFSYTGWGGGVMGQPGHIQVPQGSAEAGDCDLCSQLKDTFKNPGTQGGVASGGTSLWKTRLAERVCT